MVERYRRAKGKRKLLGNHQRCWIWGRNAVTETLRAGKWPIRELRLAEELPEEARESAHLAARRLEVPVIVEPAEALARRCRSAEHQGFLAKMAPFPYAPAEDVFAGSPQPALYAVLDSIEDPFNFGAVLRSAEAMGVDAVFIRSSRQVGVTSLVARTSAGAVNHVPISRVDDLGRLLKQLRQRQITVVAAVEQAETAVFDCDWCRATAVVIGNEGAGVDESLLELCDARIGIPQFGRVGSLNAAVAAGILFYEARRQRSSCGAPTRGKQPS